MKVPAIFLFLLLFSVVIYGQTEVRPKYSPRSEKHKNKTDILERKQGLWKHYNYFGTLMWEVEYLNDMKHGISRRYYGNGRIMKETEYEYGIKNGVFKRYNYDGVISEGEYLNGKKSNQWTNYYSNGQVKNTGLYLNGSKQGTWKYYNKKGILLNSIEYKNGRNVLDILAAEKKAKEIQQKKDSLENRKNRTKYLSK